MRARERTRPPAGQQAAPIERKTGKDGRNKQRERASARSSSPSKQHLELENEAVDWTLYGTEGNESESR